MWFLEVTPLFPFTGEVRLWKTQPGEIFSSIYSVYSKEKTGSTPSLNIQMSGFMTMWPNKDENNLHSQVEKKRMFECSVQCRRCSALSIRQLLMMMLKAQGCSISVMDMQH